MLHCPPRRYSCSSAPRDCPPCASCPRSPVPRISPPPSSDSEPETRKPSAAASERGIGSTAPDPTAGSVTPGSSGCWTVPLQTSVPLLEAFCGTGACSLLLPSSSPWGSCLVLVSGKPPAVSCLCPASVPPATCSSVAAWSCNPYCGELYMCICDARYSIPRIIVYFIQRCSIFRSCTSSSGLSNSSVKTITK